MLGFIMPNQVMRPFFRVMKINFSLFGMRENCILIGHRIFLCNVILCMEH